MERINNRTYYEGLSEDLDETFDEYLGEDLDETSDERLCEDWDETSDEYLGEDLVETSDERLGEDLDETSGDDLSGPSEDNWYFCFKPMDEEVKIGEIYFTDVMYLCGVCLENSFTYDEYDYDDFDTISWRKDLSVEKYCKSSTSTTLLAIKYLGNGIFEEMTTGEKIMASCTYLGNTKLPDITLKNQVILNYKDYLNFCYTNVDASVEDSSDLYGNKENLGKFEYSLLLQSCIERIAECPLILSSDCSFFKIDDENAKKVYLLNSNEERKTIIEEVKKMSLSNSKEVIEKIASTIESMKTISSREIEIAYLDNQLFDFKNKTKQKKYNCN